MTPAFEHLTAAQHVRLRDGLDHLVAAMDLLGWDRVPGWAAVPLTDADAERLHAAILVAVPEVDPPHVELEPTDGRTWGPVAAPIDPAAFSPWNQPAREQTIPPLGASPKVQMACALEEALAEEPDFLVEDLVDEVAVDPLDEEAELARFVWPDLVEQTEAPPGKEPANAAAPKSTHRAAWTAEEDARVFAMRDAGHSSHEIGASIGRTGDAVRVHLHELRIRGDGVPPIAPAADRPTAWAPEEAARALALRAEGRKLREIAAAIGRTEQAVRNHLHKLRARSVDVPFSQATPITETPAPAPAKGEDAGRAGVGAPVQPVGAPRIVAKAPARPAPKKPSTALVVVDHVAQRIARLTPADRQFFRAAMAEIGGPA